MLKDITIGQYYSTDSIIHKLDPRTKIIATLILIISLFIYTKLSVFIIAGIYIIAIIHLSKVPLAFILRGMKSIMFLIAITLIFNIFLTPGEEILRIPYINLKVSIEGLKNAGYTVVRLIYLIIGSSLMTLTTTPNNLTDGLEKLLMPLSKLKVPVHEIAMMMSIALRFIPILMEEMDKIMKAQTARGADFEHGGLIKRSKALIPILVPLFVSSFRRANDLAMAMEARCYRGGEGRTKMKPLKYKKIDYISYFCLATYMGLIIATGVLL